MAKPIVIVGTGLLAEQMRFYFEQQAGRRVEAHALDPEYLREDTFLDRPVLAFDDAVQRFPAATHDLFVAIGHTATAARKLKVLAAQALGYDASELRACERQRGAGRGHRPEHADPGARCGLAVRAAG